jgi:hypothetical protein
MTRLHEQVTEISEQNKPKREHHEQLLEENSNLKERIEKIRASKAT